MNQIYNLGFKLVSDDDDHELLLDSADYVNTNKSINYDVTNREQFERFTGEDMPNHKGWCS